MPLAIVTVPLRIVVPQPDTGLPPEQQPAYQVEQQVWAHAQQVDAEGRAMQWWGQLASKRATIEAQLAELHHRKTALEAERGVTVYLTPAQARARDVAATINREGMQCHTPKFWFLECD
jgi:hypothetical protein